MEPSIEQGERPVVYAEREFPQAERGSGAVGTCILIVAFGPFSKSSSASNMTHDAGIGFHTGGC